MTTITREQAKDLRNAFECWQQDYDPAADKEQYEMFGLGVVAMDVLLASLDAGSDSNSRPAHGTLSNYRLHRIREILNKAAAQSGGGNLGYAMSDAVKVIDELLGVRKAEPVAWTDEEELRDVRRVGFGEMFSVEPISPNADMCRVIPLYTAPTALVAMKDHQIRKLVNELRDIAVEYHGTQQLRERIARTIRTAMLNHSGDVTEVGEAIKQQSTMQPSNGAMSGDAVKPSSSNAQRR